MYLPTYKQAHLLIHNTHTHNIHCIHSGICIFHKIAKRFLSVNLSNWISFLCVFLTYFAVCFFFSTLLAKVFVFRYTKCQSAIFEKQRKKSITKLRQSENIWTNRIQSESHVMAFLLLLKPNDFRWFLWCEFICGIFVFHVLFSFLSFCSIPISILFPPSLALPFTLIHTHTHVYTSLCVPNTFD